MKTDAGPPHKIASSGKTAGPSSAYMLRRIEQFYRRAAKYRYKLTADRRKISLAEIAKLLPKPERLFEEIGRAIVEYYRLSRRKTITVDAERLETIRANAQRIQEKLLAGAEQDEPETAAPAEPAFVSPVGGKLGRPLSDKSAVPEPVSGWGAFLRVLAPAEKTALRMMLQNASARDLQLFAKSGGVMLEVLVDGINQKAIEAAGNTLLELGDEITLWGIQGRFGKGARQ